MGRRSKWSAGAGSPNLFIKWFHTLFEAILTAESPEIVTWYQLVEQKDISRKIQNCSTRPRTLGIMGEGAPSGLGASLKLVAEICDSH